MQPTGYSAVGGRRSEPPSEPQPLSVWDRAVVLVSALVVTVVGLSAMVVGLFGWNGAGLLALPPVEEAARMRVAATGLGAALALLGAAAVRPAVFRAGRERAIVRATGLGEVHISLRAIQSLARRAASQVQGIREAEVHVRPALSGDVSVQIHLTVLPDESIPELCDEVQARVDQYLRQTAGVSAGQITVWVRSIARETRSSRLET